MKKSNLLVALIAIGIACNACAGRPSQGVMAPIIGAVEGASSVPIFVATNRQRSADPNEMFGGERSSEMSYAAVTVSIPPDENRKIGQVQWPDRLPGDPRRHFVTASSGYLDQKTFKDAVDQFSKKTGRSKVLIFVHGFNNKFDDAVYRFAQIVHDSKVPVIPVLFTWPSRGEVRLRAYTHDRESANYSRDSLEELLRTVEGYRGVSEVTLLAHSMGNWVAMEALRGRSMRGESVNARRAEKLKSVLLVAPDVDVDVFQKQLLRIGPARPRIALFVSNDDPALRMSQIIWGGTARLGDIDPSQEPYRSELERERIMVFDLTKLGTRGDDAHSRAFEDVTSVMAMITRRLSQGQSMGDRGAGLGDQLEQAAATIGR